MCRNRLPRGAATCSMKMLQDPQHFLKAALRTRDATENQCADRSVDAVVGNWQCVCRADSDLDRHTHSAGFLAKVKLHETIGLHAHPAHPVWQQVAEIHSRTRSDLEHDPGNICKHSSLVLRYETLVTRVETGKRPRKNSLSESCFRGIHPSHSHLEPLGGIVPVTLSSTPSLRGAFRVSIDGRSRIAGGSYLLFPPRCPNRLAVICVARPHRPQVEYLSIAARVQLWH